MKRLAWRNTAAKRVIPPLRSWLKRKARRAVAATMARWLRNCSFLSAIAARIPVAGVLKRGFIIDCGYDQDVVLLTASQPSSVVGWLLGAMTGF